MFEDVSTIIASASAVIASAIAVYGINVWRREHLGRRRIDLAEEVLALFYEAADVISAARSPLGFEGEGTTRRSSEEETPQQKAVRDAAFVLIERLQSRNDLFARIRSLRYRFKAQNGRESAQPFEDLLAIRRKLIASSRQLSRLWLRQQLRTLTPEERSRIQEQVEEAERVFYGTDEEDDPVFTDLEHVITNIEKTCREVIR